jgi:hypothetical protein
MPHFPDSAPSRMFTTNSLCLIIYPMHEWRLFLKTLKSNISSLLKLHVCNGNDVGEIIIGRCQQKHPVRSKPLCQHLIKERSVLNLTYKITKLAGRRAHVSIVRMRVAVKYRSIFHMGH